MCIRDREYIDDPMTRGCEPFLVTHADDKGKFEFDRPKQDFHQVLMQWGPDKLSTIILDGGNKFPRAILVVESESPDHKKEEKHGHCGCGDDMTSNLPSADDLTSGNFSSDLGTGCNVKFKPNRTLEEYSYYSCLLYTSPSPRDATLSRMPSSA